jgi:hypothetical protein
MAAVQILILQSGRSDAYGLPLTPGSIVTVDRDYAVSLTSTGFASWMNSADAYDGETNLRKPSESYVLFQSGIPFWLPPGDGGANGLIFTGTRGVFTLSAAAPMQYAVAFTRSCYCYLPPGSGGLVTGGWYWCQMSDDTNGEIFQEMYSGTGQPAYISSPTAHPNLTPGRITQTLSEVTAIAVTVPGNCIGPNGILRALFASRQTNSATTKGARVKIAGISFGATGGSTTACVLDYESWIQNQGTSQKHSRVSGNAGRAHASTTTMTSTDSSGTLLDTSVDTQFTGILYLGAATDSVIAVFRKVSVEYGA